MKKREGVYYYLSLLTQIGLTMVMCIVFAFLLYRLYNRLIGENIFVLIALIIFGVVGGFYNVYKLVMKK